MHLSSVRRVSLAPPVALCLVAACGGGRPAVPPSRYPDLHCQPGSFSAPDDSGNLVTLPRPGHRATLLDFWARWCKPCRESLLKALARRDALAAQGIGLVLVGILEQDESIADARSVLESWGAQSPFIIDREGTVMSKYGLNELPAAVVLDQGGSVQWVSPPDNAGIDAATAAAERASEQPCDR